MFPKKVFECVYCHYDKTEDEIQYIVNDKCICKECYPKWADHETALLEQKLQN